MRLGLLLVPAAAAALLTATAQSEPRPSRAAMPEPRPSRAAMPEPRPSRAAMPEPRPSRAAMPESQPSRAAMPVRSAADALPPAQLAGQRIVFGFDGVRAPRDLLRRVRRGEAAGVILFARNIRSRGQLRRLTAALQRWRPAGDPPLLVAIDQEGGVVKRLAGAPRRSPAELGRAGSEPLARAEGLDTARNLRGVGVNVDLAPVVDIGRPGRIMRAQGRAFSSRPATVARLAAAFARGLREGGVAATAKHFPGLGGARFDQDRRMNAIDLPAATLRAEDYAPYERLVDDGLELVMTSTAAYPALDPDRPAVFSPRILGGELRGRIGFAGVTITDSLGTESATRFGSPERRALRAARAGNDLLLFASSYAAGVRAQARLADALGRGALARAPFEASAERVASLRAGLARR
ncbi:MAG TPA: glycoside hydrolase family 3 N-terminal domain-containing protein [Thermoleophilaceae bacterium]